MNDATLVEVAEIAEAAVMRFAVVLLDTIREDEDEAFGDAIASALERYSSDPLAGIMEARP